MVTIVDELLGAANRVANEEADLLNRAADRICAQWQKLDDADKVIDTLRRQVDEWADKCAKAEAKLAREVRVERTTARDRWLTSKVKCPKCRCTRMVKNCERYVETESWEMPWIEYEVCICPKCGSDMEDNA